MMGAAQNHDETDPLQIDLIHYLSGLDCLTDPLKIQSEYTLLKPALAALYQSDRALFAIATKLVKDKLGISRRDVEADLRPLMDGLGETQATHLVTLADEVDLYHDPDGEAWASLRVHDHLEHYPVKSRSFRRWLARQFFEEDKKVPGSQAVQDALGVLEGKAVFAGPEHPIFTRLAHHEGKIFLDLSNDAWEAIEIAPTGWRVVLDPPVRFRRTKGMSPLPMPTRGSTLEALRPFVNIRAEDWPLLIAWLLMTFSPTGPYPVLGLSGEQGSTKSTTARVVRSLIDPSSTPLRAVPREERDLMISARAGWVLAFDNLSVLPQWLSDAFCRLATGGGFSTRALYTDDEEMLFDAQRPVLFTAIEDVVLIGDLVDRGIRLVLPTIDAERRKPESLFWQEFEAARPRILGAVLDVVATALRDLPQVQLSTLPRMADFAKWATAAEPGLGWKPGTFLNAYTTNRVTANDVVLEASGVATTLQEFLANQGKVPWEGTATELLEELGRLRTEQERKARSWPKSPLALSNALRRLAPSLRTASIDITFSKTSGQGSKRVICLGIGKESSVASVVSDAPHDFTKDFGDALHEPATQSDAPFTTSDAKNSHKNKDGDDSDARVAPLPIHSHERSNTELF